MAEPEERVIVSAEQLGLQPGEEFEGHLEYDLGNLMACDSSLQDAQALSGDREAHCLEAATQITQSLVSRLFKLPGQAVGMGRVVSLPAPTFPLPRQKPMPTPRPPTRWEKFAQEKGIQKRKRSVKVWDEEQQEWRRRFGYQRAGDDSDIPIVAAGAGDQAGEDLFSQMKKDKAGRVKAGQMRELANVKNALKKAGRGAVPPTLKLAASLPEHGRGRPSKKMELKDDIKTASRAAGISTASMGKFDKKVKGEKAGDRHLGSKRRKFDPVVGDMGGETAKAANAAAKIIARNADNVADIERAATAPHRANDEWIDDEPGENKKFGKGKGKGKGGKGGKKGVKKETVKGRKRTEAKGKGKR